MYIGYYDRTFMTVSIPTRSVNVDPNNGFMVVGSGALNTPSLERSANTLLQYWLYFRSFMLLLNNANARCRFDDESVM